jgi:tetratricopeptide (TPR) repeat protein
VIVPRRSALLTLTPTVRWTALPDTARYTVTLSSAGGTLWNTTVTGTTELAYPPAGAPPLERGQSYRFAVTTATAGPEDAPRLGFSVLGAEAAQAIEAEAQAIRDQGLDPETTAVLLANLYARNELFADALLQLDTLAAPTTQPAVELLRGNLYVSIGLPDLARAPYEQALVLAEQADNPPAQALAHARLAAVEALLGNTAAARTHYEQAISLFRALGAGTQVEELTAEMEQLPE